MTLALSLMFSSLVFYFSGINPSALIGGGELKKWWLSWLIGKEWFSFRNDGDVNVNIDAVLYDGSGIFAKGCSLCCCLCCGLS